MIWPPPAEADKERRKVWRNIVFKMEVTHSQLNMMMVYGERFAIRAIQNQKPGWVILSGKAGCGKTRIAKRACRFMRDYAINAYEAGYWRSGELPKIEYRDWPKTVEKKSQDEYEDSIFDVLNADVVVLDDVGAETDPYKSGEPISRLRSLLGRLENKAVLITTNIRATDFENRDERIASRLSAAKRFDGFDIPDYRPKLSKS